jgi:hypothetical protein
MYFKFGSIGFCFPYAKSFFIPYNGEPIQLKPLPGKIKVSLYCPFLNGCNIELGKPKITPPKRNAKLDPISTHSPLFYDDITSSKTLYKA